ncbi:hypothetical protein RCOM_1021950 [Ricinus communis]|uniref:Uncharacterized protein n=1 Tax=Ricinus communis TaxID=3988 RepID=B9RWM6_RICCO|nr:hypothetical protein RCOM_1021950 [Ricinus communis]
MELAQDILHEIVGVVEAVDSDVNRFQIGGDYVGVGKYVIHTETVRVIIGVGGVGHMAVKICRAFGLIVTL